MNDESEKLLTALPRGKPMSPGSEQLWVRFKTYNGRPFVDLRLFYTANDESLQPTKKGVSIRMGELDTVIEALERAKRMERGE